MSKDHPFRAPIPPVAEGIARPLWSVMIPTYHCARYLRETLMRLLAQDPGAELMQIEVIDDCSTRDDPAAVVADVGQGRVQFYRQPQNVGHIRNFESCLRRAHGQWVHLLHGDDYVLPGFYERMGKAFVQNPTIGAAFCRQIFMDEKGHWQAFSALEQDESGLLANALERLALEQRIMTPSIVVRRSVYEHLGGFDCRLACAEDWEMWVRIAAHYPVWYEVEPLAVYRMHNESNTGRHVRSGADTRYNCLAIEIFSSYLPAASAERITRQARETYARAALQTAAQLSTRGDRMAMLAQIREALRCHCTLRALLQALRVGVRSVLTWLWPAAPQKAGGG
jgi:glycosyltransferase involved in cell wall biosynthesis